MFNMLSGYRDPEPTKEKQRLSETDALATLFFWSAQLEQCNTKSDFILFYNIYNNALKNDDILLPEKPSEFLLNLQKKLKRIINEKLNFFSLTRSSNDGIETAFDNSLEVTYEMIHARIQFWITRFKECTQKIDYDLMVKVYEAEKTEGMLSSTLNTITEEGLKAIETLNQWTSSFENMSQNTPIVDEDSSQQEKEVTYYEDNTSKTFEYYQPKEADLDRIPIEIEDDFSNEEKVEEASDDSDISLNPGDLSIQDALEKTQENPDENNNNITVQELLDEIEEESNLKSEELFAVETNSNPNQDESFETLLEQHISEEEYLPNTPNTIEKLLLENYSFSFQYEKDQKRSIISKNNEFEIHDIKYDVDIQRELLELTEEVTINNSYNSKINISKDDLGNGSQSALDDPFEQLLEDIIDPNKKRLERERVEQERIEEEERLERERVEQERIEEEKRLERERVEKERVEVDECLEKEKKFVVDEEETPEIKDPINGEKNSQITNTPSYLEQEAEKLRQAVEKLIDKKTLQGKFKQKLSDLVATLSNSECTALKKQIAIERFVRNTRSMFYGSILKRIMGALALFVAAAVITAAVATISFLIGLAAGAWTGPGAFFTALLAGSAAAITVLTLFAVAGVLSFAAAGAGSALFFLPSIPAVNANYAVDEFAETIQQFSVV